MKAKNIILALFIGILLLGVGSHSYGRMFANSSEGAFVEDNGGAVLEEANLNYCGSIRELIIRGAEYFFKAQAHIDLLSGKVEISDLEGVDFIILKEILAAALENMNTTRYYYRELTAQANNTPYNQEVIARLMTFDYDRFRQENGLLGDVFEEMRAYLVNGDVRGLYGRASAYFDSIDNILETIKKDVDAGIIPANIDMWNLNQVCVKAHMLGQYTARVFYAVM